MTSLECEYCKRNFSVKGSLLTHQKTAKYCLILQGKENENKYECNFCLKQFTLKQTLQEHLSICKKKSTIELDNQYQQELKEQNKQLIEKENQLRQQNEQLREYNVQLKEFQIILKERESQVRELKEMLEKANQTIAEIAMQPKIEKTTDNIDIYDELPLTISEKINDAIDTIDNEGHILTISTFTLNNVTITSRHPDHYVNATELCQAGGKKFNHWVSLESTKDLIRALESDTGIPVSLLVESKRGQTSKFNQGSWIHPDLAIQLAQWISPSFALQVSRWIRSLFDNGAIEIDIALLKDQEKQILVKDQRIKQLEEICLSKQRRVEYPERNVIYMLTTDSHIKRRTYIIGKAKNLTTRLGTYNKTCDHTVVYYRECKNEEDMTTIENLVLSKLKDYREQANRDRFILPDDKDVSFFTSTIDQCIDFL